MSRPPLARPAQLSLLPDVELVHTQATEERTSQLWQCAWCGLLVCLTNLAIRLGPCPACDSRTWWGQDHDHVGPFHIGPRRDP